MRSLLSDERAQASTEYILILAVATGLFIIVSKKLIKPALKLLQDKLSAAFENVLFGADMHTIRLKR